jgi:hypothetical protein
MSQTDRTETAGFDAWDCPSMEVAGEPQVGITLYPEQRIGGVWLCWEETVSLHKWLSELIEASRT